MAASELTDEQHANDRFPAMSPEPLSLDGPRDTGAYHGPNGEVRVAVEGERVSDADRRLVMRLEARIAALHASAQEIRETITSHLAQEYQLRQGDTIQEDGTVVRADPQSG